MPTITTRRDFLRFYVLMLFFFLFCVVLGGFIMYMAFYLPPKDGHKSSSDYILLPLGALLVFMGFYTVYSFFKKSPIITVNNNSIWFNKDEYNWADIKDIILTGKQPFWSAFDAPMEGAKFTCRDGTELYMFDYMYTNSGAVKSFIQQVIIDKSSYATVPDNAMNDAGAEDFETFKGPQLLSFYGIMCWLLIGFLVFMMAITPIHKVSPTAFIVMGCFLLFWLTLSGWLMHYFKVSQNFLVIKDHIYFWQNTVYRISDIKEVVFESARKQPNCLRVITNDFHSKLYPAGTLRDKTWLLMKDKLESYGVKVRNECIPESSS